MLEMSATADSDLRRKLTQIDTELRESHTTQQTNQELLDLLRQARLDPEQFLATPNKLLESQPALRRLKEGLVDAELRTANLLGTMTENHPLVANARWMQQEVRGRLHGEIDVALRGVELDLRLADSRRQMLLDQAADARRRLDRLAGMRADYSLLAAQVRQRTALVEEAQKDLADARACQAGAVASLISPLDAPELGSRPVGPGNLVILLAGIGGGLLLGLGLVYLTVQPAPTEERTAGRSAAVHDRLPAAGAPAANGTRYRSPFRPAARREVLSLNDALLTLAQRNTIIRRPA
jgi:uncharacterized protein involved in exopolysaccharide biosynthesis